MLEYAWISKILRDEAFMKYMKLYEISPLHYTKPIWGKYRPFRSLSDDRPNTTQSSW